MSGLNVFMAVALSAMIASGTSGPVLGAPWADRPTRISSGDRDTIADTARRAGPDTVIPPLLGPSLHYGVDTTVSPCLDFYQYVNGEWRSRTILISTSDRSPRRISFFSDAYARTQQRLKVMLDSARSVAATTTDPMLKALGIFYESCMVSDSLERPRPQSSTRVTKPPPDSTRAEQCLQRTITSLGGALGQVFAQDLLVSNAMTRMQQLLEAIRAAIVARVERNQWMNPSEKAETIERLRMLHLRVGMPKEMVDYQPLKLSATNYWQNKVSIATFDNQQWVNSIGGDIRERWKRSLLTPNAFYRSTEHAIEVPAVMFMPPFFDVNAEDALNFAGIGIVLAHEIFHSIAGQLPTLESAEMKTQIEQFKTLNSRLGTLDGWDTDGTRTYSEDVADLGGMLAAYDAWQATLKARKIHPAALVDGWTPDQRFFVALGRIWRSKWPSSGLGYDVHAAPFARVKAMVLQAPQFARAFGCKESDPMVLPANKRVSIW